MTGFTEKRFYSKTLSAKINIRSLNHRFLDWNYRGSQIGEVENKLRGICQRKFHRGRIETSLELGFLDPINWEIRINEKLLEKILFSFSKVPFLKDKNVSISLENLFKIPYVVELNRKSFSREEEAFLEESFEKTVDEVLKTRKREGREMRKEIQLHLQNVRRVLSRIEKGANKQPFLIQEKLKQRLKELTSENSLSEEKLADEAAYFAQRFDLSEEIARLRCHLEYGQELLSSKKEEPIGKKLDFLAQELFREINTIGSKAQDIGIIKEGLAIKGEVESIRQQVQNIE